MAELRNCGWLPAREQSLRRPVWARGDVFTTECPKSYVSEQSRRWIDMFVASKRFGGFDALQMDARCADAFVVLEAELQKELVGEEKTE